MELLAVGGVKFVVVEAVAATFAHSGHVAGAVFLLCREDEVV